MTVILTIMVISAAMKENSAVSIDKYPLLLPIVGSTTSVVKEILKTFWSILEMNSANATDQLASVVQKTLVYN